MQILLGLQAIHGTNVLHRDIKPGNILLSDGNEVRLTDFGVAKHLPTLNDEATTVNIGTPGYQGPEVLDRSEQHATGLDIWGVGVVFWEMLRGQHPSPEVGDACPWRALAAPSSSSAYGPASHLHTVIRRHPACPAA